MTEWQLGLRAFQEGRMRAAVDRLRAAAADRDHTVTQTARFQTLVHLGAAEYALGRPQEAVSAFEEALRIAPLPTPAALKVNLANAYLATGRRAEAERMLEETVRDAPGHVEARMLLQRLRQRPSDQQIVGATLGSSPESVLTYLRTLDFATVSTRGYDPAQVRQALSEIERYVQSLTAQLAERESIIAGNEIELQRYRQMEDVLIENALRSEQSLSEKESDVPTEAHHSLPDEAGLTPIERLFRQK